MTFDKFTVHQGCEGHDEYLIEEFEADEYRQQRPYEDEEIYFPPAAMFQVRVIRDLGAGPVNGLAPEISEDAIRTGRTLWVEASYSAFRTLERAMEACERDAKR